jgi:MATE family multidrug resistance protein
MMMIYNIYNLFILYLYTSAITTALVVRLGHHLGANQPKKTQLCVALATTLGLLFVFMNSILMYSYRATIATTFSTDSQVIEAIEELMGVGSLSHFALVSLLSFITIASINLL